jgi:hypothetical protein
LARRLRKASSRTSDAGIDRDGRTRLLGIEVMVASPVDRGRSAAVLILVSSVWDTTTAPMPSTRPTTVPMRTLFRGRGVVAIRGSSAVSTTVSCKGESSPGASSSDASVVRARATALACSATRPGSPPLASMSISAISVRADVVTDLRRSATSLSLPSAAAARVKTADVLANSA